MQLLLSDVRRMKRKRNAAAIVAATAGRNAATDAREWRFVKWTDKYGKYRLIRQAPHVFSSEQELQNAFLQGTLDCERHFCEFQHCDDHVGRTDKLEPRYVAVFCVNGAFVQPQAKHYRQAYQNRRDSKKKYDILPNGCPYWCCLYVIRISNEQASKKRYQQRKKIKSA